MAVPASRLRHRAESMAVGWRHGLSLECFDSDEPLPRGAGGLRLPQLRAEPPVLFGEHLDAALEPAQGFGAAAVFRASGAELVLEPGPWQSRGDTAGAT